MFRTRFLLPGLVLPVILACADMPTRVVDAASSAAFEAGPLDAHFEAAAREFGVPSALLKAIAFAETRMQMVKGNAEFDGQSPAFGVMALRGEQLTRGAALAGVSVEAARSDPLANIRAAAALLRAYAAELAVDRTRIGDWATAVARYSGISHPQALASYVHDAVYGVLRRGIDVADRGRVLSRIPRVDAIVPFPRPSIITASSIDFASAVWRPSPSFDDRASGDAGTPHMIIIHTCEGNYASCWGWLVNPVANVSAHYVVNEDGSEISQLVEEPKRAWHIAATYDCTLNANHDCARNGQQSNHFTIGIEHAGFASQTSWSTSQIDASARLVCDITRDRGIPRDQLHILGHGQLQPYNRTDPGSGWPWADYLRRIEQHCGSVLVIDSNNGANDATHARVEISASWTQSSATAGHYGNDYAFAATQAVSDPATFWFYLDAPATRTIDAWWTSGTNRAPSAPYLVWTSAGERLATVYVNQQANGSGWNALGTWTFPAGWNRVQLSRWTTPGYVVIADAIRVR
ncbi:MAG TPA: N-acetylmuramoyl-L-alanine amidase [Gemmatimonadaceae bacterium]|nr:N-acetylmuramoyl-L-alanine amidase [Gemmatimonadaceae bacterium]